MKYKPLTSAWKTLGSKMKGALSGSSISKFNKLKSGAQSSMGMLGTSSVIKSTSAAKHFQDNLRFKARSRMRGF